MTRFISTILAYTDIFRFPLSLNMNKKQKTSTTIGKIMTIGILAFLIASILMSDMFNKTNPKVLTQDLQITPRPSIIFAKENFTLAVGVADDNNAFYMDETVFSFVLNIYSHNLSTTTQAEFVMKKCLREDYREDPSEFDRLSLNGSFCIGNESLKLSGFWDETQIEYFWIELRTCQNSTNSPIVCKSKEEINNFLTNLYVEVILTNHNIDISNYFSPLTRSFKMYYQRLERTLTKTMNLYIKKSLIYTGDGFLYDPQKQASLSYIHGETETDFGFNADNIIYAFNVYSSNLQIVVTREYQKLDSVLAQIGGICNFLLFLGFIISHIENHHNLITFLGNELYIFPNVDIKRKDFINYSESRRSSISKKEKIPGINDVRRNTESKPTNFPNFLSEVRNSSGPIQDSARILIQNKSKKKEEIECFPKHSHSNYETKTPGEIRLFKDSQKFPLHIENTLQSDEFEQVGLRQTHRIHDEIQNDIKNNKKKLTLEHYQKLKKVENKLYFGFSNWIKLFSKNIFKSLANFNTRELLYKKTEQKVGEELDIVQILKKLHDFEKLKRILLTDEQLFFFDLVSKPMVTLNKSSLNESTDKKFRFSISKNDFKVDKVELWDMYKILEERGSFVDKKIIRLLDEDVTSFLQNENIEE